MEQLSKHSAPAVVAVVSHRSRLELSFLEQTRHSWGFAPPKGMDDSPEGFYDGVWDFTDVNSGWVADPNAPNDAYPAFQVYSIIKECHVKKNPPPTSPSFFFFFFFFFYFFMTIDST